MRQSGVRGSPADKVVEDIKALGLTLASSGWQAAGRGHCFTVGSLPALHTRTRVPIHLTGACAPVQAWAAQTHVDRILPGTWNHG